MELFSHPVVAIVILLGGLIFFHELGHFLVGKAFGIGVEVFSIGFGPVLLSFQKGETNYRLSLIPLGGFVKFCGAVRSEEVPPHLKGKEFFRAPLIGRILTVAAGPIANFLLAILVFAGLGMYGIRQAPATIGQILPDSPAEKSGLQFQDRVIEVNEKKVKTWKDLQRAIEDSPGQEMKFLIDRQGEQLALSITPDAIDDIEMARTKGRIGISPNHVPAVITVTDLDAPIAQAGLKTGMRIDAIIAGEQRYPILYWEEFRRTMSKLLDAGQLNFQLSAFEIDPKTLEKKEGQEAKVYSVSLAEAGDIETHSIEELLGVTDSQLTIAQFQEPVEGLNVGDRLISWNGEPLGDALSLSKLISENRQSSATLEVLREGKVETVTVQLKPIEVQRAEGKVDLYTIPVGFWGPFELPEFVTERYLNPFAALAYGFKEVVYIADTISSAVIGLFTGNVPLKALGGPIAIAKVASDSVKHGLQTFLIAMAWISVNLGLLNLIPIPVLDGGQLVLLFTEGVMRRPISEVVIENYQKIGFVMVLALVVMATYNDLGRFWASMLRGMTSLF